MLHRVDERRTISVSNRSKVVPITLDVSTITESVVDKMKHSSHTPILVLTFFHYFVCSFSINDRTKICLHMRMSSPVYKSDS
jgi:hypothetical protein